MTGADADRSTMFLASQATGFPQMINIRLKLTFYLWSRRSSFEKNAI